MIKWKEKVGVAKCDLVEINLEWTLEAISRDVLRGQKLTDHIDKIKKRLNENFLNASHS